MENITTTAPVNEATALLSFLRIPAVVAKTGIPRSTIYWMISEGRFPKPIKLSARSSAWRSDELDRWMASRLEEVAA